MSTWVTTLVLKFEVTETKKDTLLVKEESSKYINYL